LTRVLVIDDDSAMTDLIKLILEPETFEVVVANSGEEGIEAAKICAPHVIILDLLMPGTDGWQICKDLREFTQVPILVLSALNKPGLVTRALDEGADDFLLKPVANGILIAHLKNLTRRARAEREASHTKHGPRRVG